MKAVGEKAIESLLAHLGDTLQTLEINDCGGVNHNARKTVLSLMHSHPHLHFYWKSGKDTECNPKDTIAWSDQVLRNFTWFYNYDD